MTTFYAELIQPAELDYENSDTDTLLTCQLDDSTTVTNLITGATGEVFDVANLIGVATSSGERLSATWTLKPTGIDLDPFSLLKTQTDVNQEYHLVKSTTTPTVTLSTDTSISNNFVLDLLISVSVIYTASILGLSSAATNIKITPTSLIVTLQGSSKTFTLINNPVTYSNIVVKLSAGTLLAYQNGVQLIEIFTGMTQGLALPSEYMQDSESTSTKYIRFISSDFPVASRFWEFNQTKGETVVDHINGAIATLNGFTVDSGYVRGANGQIEGYQFTTTTTATLTLTGAYTGLMTYSDNTTLAISGTGNYIVNSGTVKSITATDTIKSYNWDATIPDSTKIIDIQSGNHAVIANVSVDKWQPVILKDVFTVGVAVGITTDYNTFNSFQLARKTQANKQQANIYGVTADNANIYMYNGNFLGGLDVIATSGYEWDMQSTNTVQAEIPSAIFIYDIKANFKNVIISTQGGQNAAQDTCKNNAEIAIKKSKNCLLLSGGTFIDPSTDYSILDCIVIGRLLQNGGKSLTIVNSVLDYASKHLLENVYGYPTFISNSVFANNFAFVGNMDQGGNLVSQPINTYFTDPANNDYTINTTGQAALKTKGWNGTDLVSWAYTIGGAVVDIPLALLNIKISPYVKSILINKNTNLSFSNIKVTASISLANILKNTSIALNSVKLQPNFTAVNISRFTGININGVKLSPTLPITSINRYTAIDCKSVSISTSLNTLSIARNTFISLSSVGIFPKIQTVNISSSILLSLLNVKILPKVPKYSLLRYTSINLNSLQVRPTVATSYVSRYTNLKINDVSINSYIENLILVTGLMPTLDSGTVSLISATMKYSTSSVNTPTTKSFTPTYRTI